VRYSISSAICFQFILSSVALFLAEKARRKKEYLLPGIFSPSISHLLRRTMGRVVLKKKSGINESTSWDHKTFYFL
jgi:ABC-type spermidine/putrescine transport system permease subunit I